MILKAGSQDVTTYFKLIDSTAGTPETGYTITALDLTYIRDRAASVKADATAPAAVDSAHGDNKAIEIDSTNAPGVYRVDWPDAAFLTGVARVQLVVNGAGLDPAVIEVELIAVDLWDSVRAGLTALPNAAADALGGLPISDAGGLDLDTLLGRLNATVGSRSSHAAADVAALVLATPAYLLATDASGRVTVGSSADKTGYALTQSFPANFADLAIAITTGRVTVGTNADKSGYSISGTKQTLDALNDLAAGAQMDLVNAPNGTAVVVIQSGLATDSGLTSLQSHGDGAWSTAAGFAVPGDVTGAHAATDALISGLNDVSSADVNAACDTALSDYDAPTKSEMDAGFAALNDLSTTDVAGAVWNAAAASYDAEDSFGNIFNDVVEEPVGGVYRFTSDALAQAPTGSGASVDDIADAVWDEAIAGHTTGSTFGGKNQKGVPSETVNDYKADVSGLATGAEIAALNDIAAADVWAVGTRALTDKAGFSLAADQAVNVTKVGGTSVTGPNDLKADVSGLATSAALSALESHGDGAWATAAGFATASALSTVASNVTGIKAITDEFSFNVDGDVIATLDAETVALTAGHGLAMAVSIAALNDFDPANDTVEHVNITDQITANVTIDPTTIWQQAVNSGFTANQAGGVLYFLKQILNNKLVVSDSGDTATLYADDGTTALAVWPLKDRGGAAISLADGVVAQRGVRTT